MSAFEEKFKLAADECGFKPVSEDPKNKEFAVEYPINKRFALNVEKVRVEAKYRATRITYRIVWINGISQKRKTLNTKSIEYRDDTTLLEIQSLLAKLATSGRQMAEVYGHLA